MLQHPAGAFKLYVVPEKQGTWGDRVEGTVEAGRVYFVKVGVRYGGVSAVSLSARSDPEEWPNRKTYVTDLDRVTLDSSQLAGLVTELGDTKALMAQVETVVADFDAPQKAQRKVEPADGEN